MVKTIFIYLIVIYFVLYYIYIQSVNVTKANIQQGLKLFKQSPGGKRTIKKGYMVVLECFDNKNIGENGQLRKDLLLNQQLVVNKLYYYTKQLTFYIDDKFENTGQATFNLISITENPTCGLISIMYDRNIDKDLEKIFSDFIASDLNDKIYKNFHIYTMQRQLYTDYGEYNGPAIFDWNPLDNVSFNSLTKTPYIVQATFLKRPNRFRNFESKEQDEKLFNLWKNTWETNQGSNSEILQPRAKYVRNVILDTITEGSPRIDGIVFESWPGFKFMKNPFFYFNANNPLELITHLCSMLLTVTEVFDLTQLSDITVSEYIY